MYIHQGMMMHPCVPMVSRVGDRREEAGKAGAGCDGGYALLKANVADTT